jgi:hypothetical protein
MSLALSAMATFTLWRINKNRLTTIKNTTYKNYKLTSYMFQPSWGQLEADI